MNFLQAQVVALGLAVIQSSEQSGELREEQMESTGDKQSFLTQLHLCCPPLRPNIEYLKVILCTGCFVGYLMFTEEPISV